VPRQILLAPRTTLAVHSKRESGTALRGKRRDI